MVMPVGVGGVQYNVRYTIPRDVIQYVSLLSGLFLDQAPNYPNLCIKFLPYSLRRDFFQRRDTVTVPFTNHAVYLCYLEFCGIHERRHAFE